MDARQLALIVPPESVDVTITSPPYYNLKDYGYSSQIGHGQDYDSEYLRDVQNILSSVYRATKRTGSLWIVVDNFRRHGRLVPLPFDVAQRAEREGWRLTDIIVWNKTKSLPWSGKGQLRSVFEYILFMTKSDEYKFYLDRIREPTELKQWWVKYPERYNPRGKVPSGIWTFPIPTQGSWGNGFLRHFCPFPSGLVERILLLTTDEDDVVMDPFAGSGVVLAQAHWMHRRYLGFELKEDYCEMFHSKVLPAIGNEWEARVQLRERTEQARKRLEETIKKLRQLKFANSLIKAIAAEKNCAIRDLDINTVFVISTRANGQWPRNGERLLREEIYIVMEDHASNVESVSTIAEGVLERSPSWEYTIQAELHVATRRDVLRLRSRGRLFPNENLWLYLAPRFNWFRSEITFTRWSQQSGTNGWRESLKANSFALVSNIKIRQAVREFHESDGYQTELDS